MASLSCRLCRRSTRAGTFTIAASDGLTVVMHDDCYVSAVRKGTRVHAPALMVFVGEDARQTRDRIDRLAASTSRPTDDAVFEMMASGSGPSPSSSHT